MIPAFVITADHETDRVEMLEDMQKLLPCLEKVSAIYPSRIKVPFLHTLQVLSRQRTGWQLNDGEIGVLLSNRKTWREIIKRAVSDNQMFLVLESDSYVRDIEMLTELYPAVEQQYDLFFWGGWEGHIQLERSSRQKYKGPYTIGVPYIKTVYGAYGYSLNRKAAQYLLKQTGKISYPVDQYKRFITPGYLRIGSVIPEIIPQRDWQSTIGHPTMPKWQRTLWLFILDCKNALICFFK